jgi:hypothetical protein
MFGVWPATLAACDEPLSGNAPGVSACAEAGDDKLTSDILTPIQYKLSFNMNVSPFLN